MQGSPENGRGFAVWFTGLPCSGKTTLSLLLAERLAPSGLRVEAVDGDELRRRISPDLGYSREDRRTHIRRAAELARRLRRDGKTVLISLISPHRDLREEEQKTIPDCIEVYVRCPLEVCEKRDVKGMYRLAREGKIKQFTGISDEYEAPAYPVLTVDTDKKNAESCVEEILGHLKSLNYLRT